MDIYQLLLLVLFSLVTTKGFQRGPSSPTTTTSLRLNRILLDAHEVSPESNTATLGKDDYRFAHITKILKLDPGDTIKLGVTDLGKTDSGSVVSMSKAEIVLSLGTDALDAMPDEEACSVDLLLAVPRPLRLERLLPVISCIGVGRLVLLGAAKVEKDYFGSHLFRRPEAVRAALVEGLSQACVDVRLPKVSVERRLKDYLQSGELDAKWPRDQYKRVLAHPPKGTGDETRLTALPKDTARQTRIVVAVGPEGGWEEAEVAMFLEHGFVPVSLGPRILRADMAVQVLLGLAHEWVRGVV